MTLTSSRPGSFGTLSRSRGWSATIAGFACHVLVTLPMLGAGIGKAFRLAPQHVMAMFETQYHMGRQMQMIGFGELLCIVLLLVPRTLPFGILMTSAYWGGAIAIHMSHDQTYVVPAVLLVLSWIGYFLRLSSEALRSLLKGAT